MKTNNNISLKILLRSRTVGLVAAVLLAIITLASLGLAANAWGPSDRATFTQANPATYVTFNSITDNPAYGDERNFFRVKEASAGNETYTDEIKLTPGKTYRGYVFVHNNASRTLNTAENNYKGIATNTKLRINMPNAVTPGSKARVNAYVSADNANPQQIWDEAYMTADQPLAIRYVSGSAKLTNEGGANGAKIPDSFLTTGALLGYDSLNGRLPGCNEFAGYVTFDFVADQPNFTFKKEVSKDGENKWGDSITAKPGEKVNFMLSYRNTGTTQQNNVILKDSLPKGMKYVARSTEVANSSNPKGAKAEDGVTEPTGVNYGSYAPKGNLFVRFSATVPAAEELSCGPNRLRNTATASTNNGAKTDTADVLVEVKCQPNECKPGVPEGDERCEEEGVVPGELPTTGPAEIVAGVMGVTLVSLGVAYWIRSRQEYRRALAGFSQDSTEEPEHLLEARTDHRDGQEDRFRPVDNLHANFYHGGRRR